ncbi:MAG: hypothetical protein P8J78_06805 [Maricaulis sp.]|nr:hypothetical protein [Maricaulis sp.]
MGRNNNVIPALVRMIFIASFYVAAWYFSGESWGLPFIGIAVLSTLVGGLIRLRR